MLSQGVVIGLAQCIDHRCMKLPFQHDFFAELQRFGDVIHDQGKSGGICVIAARAMHRPGVVNRAITEVHRFGGAG